MTLSKLIALFITLCFSASVVYFTVLKPEGYTFDKLNFPKLSFSKSKQNKEYKASFKSKKDYSKPNTSYSPKVIDSFNGVEIYDNGKTTNVYGRNTTKDGYNLGLRYQCVEFVKRYYYEYYNHKMPDSYGHAREFFNTSLPDGRFNSARGLYQFKNKSKTRPQAGDLLVFGPTPGNSYGHVAIIASVQSDNIEIVQQNPGQGNSSRVNIALGQLDGKWYLYGKHILGWLRKD